MHNVCLDFTNKTITLFNIYNVQFKDIIELLFKNTMKQMKHIELQVLAMR